MSTHHNQYEEFDEEFEYEDEGKSSINWGEMVRKLYAKRWTFVVTFVVTLVIFVPLLYSIPQYYTVRVKLAPELSGGNSTTSMAGRLGSSLSFLGIGGNSASSDAIGPLLYPDLMTSTTFLTSLFDIHVISGNGRIDTTYYTYLLKYQKHPFWAKAVKLAKKLIPKVPSPPRGAVSSKAPRGNYLTQDQSAVTKLIAINVLCSVDEETGVISIDVTDQDPFICATVADSTCRRLQQFITEYRSKKDRQTMLNIEKQLKQAKEDYATAKQRVEDFNNSNWDLIDEDMKIQKQDLQNKMQMAFQVMSSFNNQYLAARSKYEGSLPVYTVLDNPTVPLLPSGPSKTKYLLAILILVFGVEISYILFKDMIKQGISSLKEPAAESHNDTEKIVES